MTVPTLSFVDRVIFTAASAGAGAFVQSAAVTGYQTMQAAGAVSANSYGYSAQSADLHQWEVGYGTWTAATSTLTRTVLYNSSGTTSAISFSSAPQVMVTALAESLGSGGGGGTDPLFLTQGLSVIASNPTVGSNPNDRRAVQFNTTYDTLNTNVGFTDQNCVEINLNFNAGLNVYNQGTGGTQAKYTPNALLVSGTFYGAGEKFLQDWFGDFWSMGDSFMWSGQATFSGGPIGGDEGQGFTPNIFMQQAPAVAADNIATVARTGYSTTITANVTGSQTAQDISVASTVGAVVGDWIIINPQPNTPLLSQTWAMQILSINPGVSINGVCAVNVNANSGFVIKPALVMTLAGGPSQFGEQRLLINRAGTSYSTGLVGSVSGGGFVGSGTTWTNTMVGGDAFNIGAVYLDVDTYTLAPYSSGSPLRSFYQIQTVVSTTSIAINSNSVAGDQSYHGRATTNMTYKILPCARIMKINPPGSPWHLICEYSAHTWTAGDLVECAICPYPDVHGLDYRMAQWTPGGTRRSMLSLTNFGARQFQQGILVQPTPGGSVFGTAQTDTFAFGNGIEVEGASTGLYIFDIGDNSSILSTGAIDIAGNLGSGHASDLGSRVLWTNWGYIGIVAANQGMDWSPGPTTGLLRAIGSAVNIDTVQQQLVWNGYLQIAPPSGAAKLRFSGDNSPGSSITDTFDITISGYLGSPANAQTFLRNTGGGPRTLFLVTDGGNGPAGAVVPANGAATAGVNQPSQSLQAAANVWNGSSSNPLPVEIAAMPDSLSSTNSEISMQFRIYDYSHADYNRPNVAMSLSSQGLLSFGYSNLFFGGGTRVTLDPSNLTAPRAVKFMDTAGDILVAAANTTGAGTPLFGTNSPAVTNTAPYTWLKMLSHDGSTVYVPAWK